MKSKQRVVAIVLVLLLGAAIFALVRTREANNPETARPSVATEQAPQVDQTPLLTAQQFAKMPTGEEEKPFAEEALRLGDQEMDLAFAAAVRDAQMHPPVLNDQAKEIQAHLHKAEDALDADKKRFDQLTAEDAKASGSHKDALDKQLDVAKAQLELDQDEVDESKQDLMRAGGDPQSRIQAMVDEHEAASHSSDATKVAVTTPEKPHGLIHLFQQWSTLHSKQLQLWRAKQAAETAVATFSARHAALETKVNAVAAQPHPAPAVAPAKPASAKSTKTAPGKTANTKTANAGPTPEESAAMVQSTRLRANDQKTLTSLAKRIDNQQQLAGVYANWINVVSAKQRRLLHQAVLGLTLVLGILLVGVFFDGWLEHLLGKTSLDRRQVETLRTVTRVTLQVLAFLFILLVIFGPPTQIATVLGLAGAGLTVALKDFIVGFLGWFVLMGKNGIRLGDWVEINGVTGEVVELGMFHTVLLETGNWTDSSHPTGRRVTFTNSFAIEGHYFNFSTSGQWLWDELQIVVPSGQDPYPIVAAIQKKVLEVTSEGAKQAETEWKTAAKSRDMKSSSAVPAVNIKPVIGGIEISVRYITRANERYQLRAQLYQAAVDLMGGQKSAAIPAVAPTAPR